MKQPGKISRVVTAIRKLIADKEDTTQVFVILETLAGNSGLRAFKRFMKTEHAAKITAAKKPLMHYLQDRKWLARLPEGSLGRVYLRFTEVEQITADGLVEASVEGREEIHNYPQAQTIFHERQRDAHDLWHVVAGYGRDPLGELCLLAVTWRQLGNLGILVIVAAGYFVTRKEAPHLRIGAALREGLRLGKRARWLPAADWEQLLTLPLDQVRAAFAVPRPTVYQNIVHQMSELQTAGMAAAE